MRKDNWCQPERIFTQDGKQLMELGSASSIMGHTNLTPEPFSQAQIDFLRCIGVRVICVGSSQSVFNDAADFADERALILRDGLRKLLHDESKTGPEAMDRPRYRNGFAVILQPHTKKI